MAEPLVCPANHRWALRANPDGDGPPPWRCPECGDLPGPGSRLEWSVTWPKAVLAIALLVVPPVLICVALIAAGLDPGRSKPWFVAASGAWIVALVGVLARRANRQRGEMGRAAAALGLSYDENRGPARMTGLMRFRFMGD